MLSLLTSSGCTQRCTGALQNPKDITALLGVVRGATGHISNHNHASLIVKQGEDLQQERAAKVVYSLVLSYSYKRG